LLEADLEILTLSVVPAQKFVQVVEQFTKCKLPSTSPVAEATALVKVTAEFDELIAASKEQFSNLFV
jgi:hypothetical protein